MRIAWRRSPSSADAQRYRYFKATSDRHGPCRAEVDTYHSRVVLQAGESPVDAFERIRERLLRYDIFSPRFVGRFIFPNGRVEDGCTIVQRLGVLRLFFESATRVVDVWDEDVGGRRCAGFAYVTLQGHPECGVATFEVRCDGDEVSVVFTARSVPGTPLTKLASPLARAVQRSITKQAVRRVSMA